MGPFPPVLTVAGLCRLDPAQVRAAHTALVWPFLSPSVMERLFHKEIRKRHKTAWVTNILLLLVFVIRADHWYFYSHLIIMLKTVCVCSIWRSIHSRGTFKICQQRNGNARVKQPNRTAVLEEKTSLLICGPQLPRVCSHTIPTFLVKQDIPAQRLAPFPQLFLAEVTCLALEMLFTSSCGWEHLQIYEELEGLKWFVPIWSRRGGSRMIRSSRPVLTTS